MVQQGLFSTSVPAYLLLTLLESILPLCVHRHIHTHAYMHACNPPPGRSRAPHFARLGAGGAAGDAGGYNAVHHRARPRGRGDPCLGGVPQGQGRRHVVIKNRASFCGARVLDDQASSLRCLYQNAFFLFLFLREQVPGLLQGARQALAEPAEPPEARAGHVASRGRRSAAHGVFLVAATPVLLVLAGREKLGLVLAGAAGSVRGAVQFGLLGPSLYFGASDQLLIFFSTHPAAPRRDTAPSGLPLHANKHTILPSMPHTRLQIRSKASFWEAEGVQSANPAVLNLTVLSKAPDGNVRREKRQAWSRLFFFRQFFSMLDSPAQLRSPFESYILRIARFSAPLAPLFPTMLRPARAPGGEPSVGL